MKLYTLATSLALSTAGAVAWPPHGPYGQGSASCISNSTASSIVSQFISVLNHYDIPSANATAQALIADDFHEISDSIDILAGYPLGSASFGSKQKYINGVLLAPSLTGIETLGIWPVCPDKILWYWLFTGIGTRKDEIKGFNLFSTVNGQVSQINVEFKSIAWGTDIGIVCARGNQTVG